MFTRLTHAGVTFALTVAAYQAYVLTVAPFVEPAGAAGPTIQALTPAELAHPPAALAQYAPLLEAYFPADHWSLHTPPKIVENGQTMVVFDVYTQSNSGELRVPRIAIIFFPTTRDRSAPPPRNAIILEPSGGATLQMDQQVGKRFGSMGRMQFGQLLGDVRVRSDMNASGPQDDLSIETKDLYMNQDLIRTTEAVAMRVGGHQGRGRGLVIHFVKTAAPTVGAAATPFGKLDTLEISNEVAALIMPGATTMFGANTAEHSGAAPARPATSEVAKKFSDAPTEITCTGPFRIDFGKHTATFTETVHAWQRHPDGAFDELTAPRDLTMYFAEKREWTGDAAGATTPTPPSAFSSMRLEPATVEARGLAEAPVQLRAQSQGAAATGERLRIELLARQVTLEGGEEVSLNFRGAEIHAPMVRYELPPKNSNQRLGLMAARGGGGWLRATPDLARPADVLEVRWTQSMQMVRRSGQPVLVLDGRPRVAMAGIGTLWADQLELYLREGAAAPAPPAGAAQGDLLAPANIEAERIVATGSVVMESAELNGKVSQLDLRVLAPPTSTPIASASSGAASVGNAIAPAPTAAPPSLFDRRRSTAARRTYAITGRTLEIDAVMRERNPQVAAIRVDGDVEFQESTPGANGEAPLRIVAEHLNVTDADTPEAKIEIRGGEATDTLPAGLAEISARGTVLRAPVLAVNRGTSQAWIRSPGEVQMLMSRDATGKPLARPQPLAITWRDSMELNRDRITFLGNVHVRHADGWLRTQRLVTLLTAPVQFDGASAAAPPELAQLECWEGTLAEFDQRDLAGQVTSHQHIEIVSMIVNQVTGAIQGVGPGHVDSIHLSKGDGSWAIMPESVGSKLEMPTPTQQNVPDKPPQLRHLSIDFVRGIDGNIHTPQVRVFGDVRTIYGPVGSWDDRLRMSAGGSPGADTIWISCDSLQVTDSPLARIHAATADGKPRAFGQVELSADVNVVIEGEHPERGAFTLRGHRATYDQAKTMFVLQGDGRTPATVTYQQFPGGPFQDQSAQKMFYWQNTGKLRVEGFSKIELEGGFD